MPPSDDRRDSPALRQEGPQQDEPFTELERDRVNKVLFGRVSERTRIRVMAAVSASRTARAPQQGLDLVTRLIDYRGQVLNGFRHISRFEEAELIQAAIDGLRPPVAPAEGEQ